jgi:MFS family permease
MGLSVISNFLASYSNKGILIVVFIIVTAIITDTVIIKTYDLIGKRESLGWRIIVFSIVVTISIVGQYLVLEFVRQKRISNIVNPREIHLNTIHKIVTLVQYVLMALLVFVLFQILVTSHYSASILAAVTSISYILATAMLALLSQRFFSWFKSNRNTVILLYGLSAAILAINSGFTFLLVNNAFVNMPRELYPTMLGSAEYLVRSPLGKHA